MLSAPIPSRSTPALSTSALPPAVVRAAARLAPRGEAAFLYDPAVAAARAARLKAALPPWVELAYAVKANAHGPVLAAIGEQVDGFEVASVGEVAAVRAARAQRPPRRLLAAGPGKTPALLDALVTAGADPINAESALEVDRIAAAARRAGRRVAVALRVNPARVPLTGALRMGGGATPFGIPEEQLPEVLAAAHGHQELDVVGFHVHAVSGNLDAAAHLTYLRWCIEFAVATAATHGVDLRVLDAGGGLGVSFDGGPELDAEALGRGLAALDPPAGLTLIIEPGRWIAAPCGWYAAPVTDLKQGRGACFAVLRGGIHHFALPASWDLVHRVAVVPVAGWERDITRPEVRDTEVSVVGELCTPEDALAHRVGVRCLRAGDVLVFPDAGSYGWEFALQQFLGHPPARRIVVDTTPSPPQESTP